MEYLADPAGKYAGDPTFTCIGAAAVFHKSIPVTNEKCLYALWMCACWANQASGCLCAYENPNQESVTIVKPQAGKCPDGAEKVEDMTAQGDREGHSMYGFGGLALKCSPNPCQACCKAKGHGGGGACGCSCGGGGGGGGYGGSGCCIS